ncbi:sodium:solute symporter family protein [Stutzerimonas stutzeri]|uniref:Sodium transporter n=1 Tax=Stutzerimonas stutzeri TaxID=316 RepID=A0A6I6M003_STUST|nr:sodium:solute symporter family protein [Stutzerimonas stutzeri]QGZ31991.1 sodium transporter [Stutzerimonas stutzeri]
MLDLLIVAAFMVYGLGSGLRARSKASRSLDEYFLAGRTIKGWKAGFSMAATQFAADTPLLVTGLVATAGIFALWRLWIYGIAFLLMAFIFAVGWRRAGVLTDAELTCVRYSGKGVTALRLLKAIYYGTVINCIVLAMVLVAAIRIAEIFLPWHLWLPDGLYMPIVHFVADSGIRLGASITGLDPAMTSANQLISILLILAFTAMYSITGGLRAVVQTDVMQFSLAMIGTLLYAWYVVDAAGGLGGLSDRLVELYGIEQAGKMLSFGPPTSTGEALMPFLVIIGLQWLFQMNSDGTGYLAQRSMACPTDRDARIAALVFIWSQIFLRSLFWMAIAIGLLVLYPFAPGDMANEGFIAGREALFVQGIDDLLPSGARGLMLVGLLAALASTVDTHLNWGASYWSNDVYAGVFAPQVLKRKPRNRELVAVARLANVLILIIAMIIMANLGSIQTAWFISLLFGAGMGSVLVLRWLWERINLYSELTAMAMSLITAPLLLVYLGIDPEREWVRLSIMAVVTTSAAILVTFVTPATDDATLKRFYRRVRPFGFWKHAAMLNGVDAAVPVKALRTRLLAVTVTAVSLFAMLLGAGRLMFLPPDGSALIGGSCLALGLLLVPVWLRIAMGRALDTDPEDEPLPDTSRVR